MTTRLWRQMALLATLAAILTAVPAGADSLAELMRHCGLKHSGPNSEGAYVVQFDGQNVPLIQVMVSATGDESLRSVCLVSPVVKVDHPSRWDPAVFPWLLEFPGKLVRGAFGLTHQGRQVVFVDNLPLTGLEAQLLGKYISLAALVVDDTYPRVKHYVR